VCPRDPAEVEGFSGISDLTSQGVVLKSNSGIIGSYKRRKCRRAGSVNRRMLGELFGICCCLGVFIEMLISSMVTQVIAQLQLLSLISVRTKLFDCQRIFRTLGNPFMLVAWSFSRVMHRYNCTLVDDPICRGLVLGYLIAVKCGKGVVKGLICCQLNHLGGIAEPSRWNDADIF